MYNFKYLVFIYLVIFNVLAYGQSQSLNKNKNQNHFNVDYKRLERKELIRSFSSHIIEDKKKPTYHNVLKDVTPFPNINFQVANNDYLVQFDKYVLDLLPYMLTKLKNKDLNGEFPVFYKALQLADNLESHISLTLLQETSYKFLLQAMQTEKSLRACSQLITKYQEKSPQMDIQLSRIDNEIKSTMVPDLNKLKQDLYFLNSTLLGELQDTKLNN